MMIPPLKTLGSAVASLVLVAGWCGLVSVREAAAQPDPKPKMTEAQAADAIADVLDQAQKDLEIAEQRGADAHEAFNRAKQRIEAVRRHDPRNVRAEYYQGRLEILGGQPNMAINKLRDWVHSRQGENDWEGHFILGKVFFDTQYYKMAEPELETAAGLNPRKASIHALLSRCATKLIKRQPAVRYARQAVEMMGTDVDADTYMLLAEALVLNQKLDDADRAARAARDLAISRLKSEGTSVDTLGKAKECIQLLLQITQSRLKVDPKNAHLYLEVARLLQQQADVGSLLAAHNAAQWALRGLQQTADGASEELVVEAARLLARIGRTKDALAILKKGRDIFPESSAVKELYEKLAPPAPQDESSPPSASVHIP